MLGANIMKWQQQVIDPNLWFSHSNVLCFSKEFDSYGFSLPFYMKIIKATSLAPLSFNNTHLINNTSHYYASCRFLDLITTQTS